MNSLKVVHGGGIRIKISGYILYACSVASDDTIARPFELINDHFAFCHLEIAVFFQKKLLRNHESPVD